MRALFVNEKFTEKSDPIRDMGIGIPKYPGFTPMFILKKGFPGMDLPIGTIFGKQEGWDALVFYDKSGVQHGNTAWSLKTYFKPWEGKFFEKI